MPSDLYEAPRAEFSQGDILDLAPHIWMTKPLLALNKESEKIFTSVDEPLTKFAEGQEVIARCTRSKAIVINHDCEIDKPQVLKWLICPVVPSTKLQPKTRELLKRNRIYSMLHLPEINGTMPESFVDFSQITTIEAELVKDGKRIISLSDIGRRALYVQFARWLTRWELREINCPNCGLVFDPHMKQSVRP